MASACPETETIYYEPSLKSVTVWLHETTLIYLFHRDLYNQRALVFAGEFSRLNTLGSLHLSSCSVILRVSVVVNTSINEAQVILCLVIMPQYSLFVFVYCLRGRD